MGRGNANAVGATRVPTAACQRRLAYVWFGAVGVLFLLLFTLTLTQRYGERDQEAWEWFLPAVVPTVTLIMGAVAHDALTGGRDRSTVSSVAYRLTMSVSIFYLLLLFALLTLHPLTQMTPLELMHRSAIFLPPLQGLVGIALGIFFASRRGADHEE